MAEIVKMTGKIYRIKPLIEYNNSKISTKQIQYKLNNSKIYKSINWLPKVDLEKGIRLVKNKKYLQWHI